MRNAIQSLAAACILAVVAGCIHGEATPAPAALQVSAPASPQWLFPVYVNGKWGFIDETGRMRIEPQFDGTYGFSRGATIQDEEQRETGDEDGPLETCLAPVRLEGKWGYIDATGKMVVPPRFDNARWFSCGLAAVNLGGDCTSFSPFDGGQWGYINLRGEWVIKPQFAGAGDFRDGVARVAIAGEHGFGLTGKYGFIDRSGQWTVQPVLAEAGNQFSSGLCPATLTKNGDWGYIDKTGRFVIPPRFAWVGEFSEGLALVSCKGSRGYINPLGIMVIGIAQEYPRCFSGGMAAVSEKVQDHWWGDPIIPAGPWKYIDKTGKVVIPPAFGNAGCFSEGLAAVREGFYYRRFGFFDEWHWEGVEDHGPAKMKHNGKWGFIDKTGQYLLPPIFDRVFGGFYHGIAEVVKEGRICYINKSDAVIWRGAAVDPSPY